MISIIKLIIYVYFSGVYVGIANYSESDDIKIMKSDGYYIPGICLAMAANRVSYSFDFKGPSYSCDSACSSSLYAIIHAVNDLNNGLIDYALVGATNLIFDTRQSKDFLKLHMISQEGYSKPFSAERNGFARSEAVVAIFLQKSNNCRRVYATIAGGLAISEGYKKEGISFPAYEAHLNLMQKVYGKFNINPDEVTYFEAHAAGKNIL